MSGWEILCSLVANNDQHSKQLFHEAIPDVGQRCQVIHHTTANGTFFSRIVVQCWCEGIIQMVLIHLTIEFSDFTLVQFNTRL